MVLVLTGEVAGEEEKEEEDQERVGICFFLCVCSWGRACWLGVCMFLVNIYVYSTKGIF